MKKKYYLSIGIALSLILMFSSVGAPVLAVRDGENETVTIGAEGAALSVSGGDAAEKTEDFTAPPSGYRYIPGEGDYESIREHLGDDGITVDMAVAIPAKYDLTDINGWLPNTRNQNPYGTCWAHSLMAVAEIGLLKNRGVEASVNLSELQLAYFMYHSPKTDPLGLTTGDKNWLSGTASFLDAGGNVDVAKKILQGWICAADDKGAVAYSNAVAVKNGGLEDCYAFDNSYHLRNYYNVNLRENPDEAKQAILQYGALTASYYDDDAYINDVSYYCYNETSTNHGVVIVGWDDNYPAANFRSVPEGNGAWLIRNSWSASGSLNYSRYTYFWISYYDTSLTGGVAMEFEPAGVYDSNYHYDAAAIDVTYIFPSGIKEANVFTAQNDEEILAVSFETNSTNVIYSVDVYRNLKDSSDPESGERVTGAKGVTSYSGYYTVPLDAAAILAKGDTFSAVVTLSHSDNSSVKIPQEATYEYGWMASQAVSDRGESFYKYPGNSWVDLVDARQGNFRVKAFTKKLDGSRVVEPRELRLGSSTLTLPYGQTETLKAVVKPDNAINKQIYWSSSDKKVVTVGADGKLTAKKIGTAVITGVLARNNTITVSCKVTVTALDIADMTVKKISNQAYTGKAVKPAVVIKNGKKTLVEGQDYKLSYSNNVKPGKAQVVITGQGNYKGSVKKTFTINDYTKKVSGVKANASGYKTVNVSWKSASGVTGYKVYRSTSKKKGYKLIATVKGAGSKTYKDTGAVTGSTNYYKVRPYLGSVEGTDSAVVSAKPAYGKLTVSVAQNTENEAVTLKWNKVSGAKGYEVYRAASEKGKYTKLKAVTANSYKDTKAVPGMTYYYKVRPYGTVNGKKVYGSYSAVKSVTVTE